MAQAPRPGVSDRDAAVEAAQRVLVVRLRDQTFRIAAGNIPLRVKERFLRETGRSVEWYFQPERIGDVALAGLWFVSRLIDREQVTWEQVLDEWDEAGFTAEDVDVTDETAQGGDDPEV